MSSPMSTTPPLLQLQHLAALTLRSNSAMPTSRSAVQVPPLQLKASPFSSLSAPFSVAGANKPPLPLTTRRPLLRFPCRMSGSGPASMIARFALMVNQDLDGESDIISQLELGKPDEKPIKRVNGIFWIILLSIGIYVADHLVQVPGIKSLYLYHNWPAWYQFLTATFCHADWNHLSSNLFFLYIFGKLVEEEEGNIALWFCYLITGAGANFVSWLLLPRNSVSVGASGAVFGLFAISVLVKMSWDWRKILEVLILGQFVIKRVMEAAQASTAMPGSFRANYSLQSINHIAHLSGALIGVLLVWLVSKVPSEFQDHGSTLHRKKDRKL